jgi:hypothetical protein
MRIALTSPPGNAAAQRESDKLAPPEFARRDNLAVHVDRVNLKRALRQIEPNRAAAEKFRIDLPMDGFPSDGLMTTTILAR